MLSPHRFDIAQVALRADPVEKRRFARLVAEPVRLKCLLRLWHELVAEQFDVMMQRFDLCQLIAQQPQRFLLFALKSLAQLLRRFCAAPHEQPRRVFAGIHPWHRERHAGVEFAHRLARRRCNAAL